MDTTDEKKINVLFVHNSVPEYRVEFWKTLSKKVNLYLLVTSDELDKKIYGFQKNTAGLNIRYWGHQSKEKIKEEITNYNIVILPPVEGIKDFSIACWLNKLCAAKGIPYVYWTEKWLLENSPKSFLKKVKDLIKTDMIKFAAHGAAMYIASGSMAREYLQKHIKAPKAKISIAFDSSMSPRNYNEDEYLDVRKKYYIPRSAKVVLFLGRLISRKGCDLLIRSVKPILKSKNIYLLICGDGEQRPYLEKIASDDRRIIFEGKVQPRIRRNFFDQANLFVLPSKNENGTIEAWGLTVNEALECGVPVVTTDAVGSAYDLINEKNGIVVKNNNIAELRNAVTTILDNYQNYDRSEIIEEYNSKYSVNNMSKSFLNILTAVTNEK